MSIIGWLILGLIAGFIGSKIVNKSGEGLLLDIILGIVGAMVGGYLFTLVGCNAGHRAEHFTACSWPSSAPSSCWSSTTRCSAGARFAEPSLATRGDGTWDYLTRLSAD